MKTKKTKRANLENFRTIFFQAGIILTLSALLFAFEWKTNVHVEKLTDNRTFWDDTEELPPVTMPKAEVKEVKPPSFEMTVVDDHEEIDFEDDLQDLFKDIEDYEPVNFDGFEENKEVVDDEPLVIAQFMPRFQGKDVNSFRAYIAENIVFPQRAKETGVAGTVFASFVIDRDGSVSEVQILRGVHPDVDNAVLKVIRSSPKWDPGINNGKFVRVRYTIPVAFQLL